jgi:hypothetical protein
MNINDVSKREVLDFKQFLGKVMDNSFKPLAPENQRDTSDLTGLHDIHRAPQYDYVGYADAAFKNKSGIGVPSYNSHTPREYTNGVGAVPGQESGITFDMSTSESSVSESRIVSLKDFDENE